MQAASSTVTASPGRWLSAVADESVRERERCDLRAGSAPRQSARADPVANLPASIVGCRPVQCHSLSLLQSPCPHAPCSTAESSPGPHVDSTMLQRRVLDLALAEELLRLGPPNYSWHLFSQQTVAEASRPIVGACWGTADKSPDGSA